MDTKTFSALAEPNRLRIVELLRDQPRSVNEIANKLSLRQPQVSKHLHTLHKANLVYVQPLAQQRIYTLNPESFSQIEDWANTFDRYWSKQFSRLDDYLKQVKKGNV